MTPLAAVALAQDLDGDGVLDADDTCPSVPNRAQATVWTATGSTTRSGSCRCSRTTATGSGSGGSRRSRGRRWAGASSGSRPAPARTARTSRCSTSTGTATSTSPPPDATSPTFWLGDGRGRFVRGASFRAVDARRSDGVEAGDLDGDGDLDLVTAQIERRPRGEQVVIAVHEAGRAGLAPPRVIATLPAARNAVELRIGDLDADGDADLAFSDGRSLWWLRDDDGTYVVESLDPLLREPGLLAIADLDADGDPELLVGASDQPPVWFETGPRGPGTVHGLAVASLPFFVNDGAGRFARQTAVGTDPLDPDTDGDGHRDGDEVAAGTDPLDAADPPAPSAPARRVAGSGCGCDHRADPRAAFVLALVWARRRR